MTIHHIIVTRPVDKPRERMRYCFDGARFVSGSRQELRGATWRNIRRWDPKQKPKEKLNIPADVRAEVREKVRLSERRED